MPVRSINSLFTLHLHYITLPLPSTRTPQPETNLEVGNWSKTLDNFVGLKRAVSAVTDRHETTLTTLKVDAVAATVDDANMGRRLRHDAERRHDHVFL